MRHWEVRKYKVEKQAKLDRHILEANTELTEVHDPDLGVRSLPGHDLRDPAFVRYGRHDSLADGSGSGIDPWR